ncbi:MAG: hypothetical protein CVU44_07985 [Chloroflexi bacterium HGW-Chloroflexi-6]|nr:MAG: hypothetical protein CVU44_07985 [Chloroflexi bacterium HGW-Chloroflexi-6]
MKKGFLFLVVVALIFSIAATPNKSNTITLTANDVRDARDIEIAMDMATDYGSRAATIVLSASKGDFFYSGDDRSINIQYSNITLLSHDGASIANCGDGIFFDSLDLQNVSISGITFHCENLGISLWSQGYAMRDITIRKNSFITGAFGIEAVGVERLNIKNNTIISDQTGMRLEDLTGSKITGNKISTGGSAGIELSGLSVRNKIHGNRVSCEMMSGCLAVSVPDPGYYKTNKITDNKVK